jgi:hypothetical protein
MPSLLCAPGWGWHNGLLSGSATVSWSIELVGWEGEQDVS